MRFLRILIPTVLIAVWLAAGAIGGPYFGRIGEVSSNDQASYLPASADATEVSELLPEFAGSDDIPAVVVAERDGGLTDADLDALGSLADDLAGVEGVGDGVSPPIESDDGEAVQLIVPIAGDVDETIAEINAVLADLPSGLTTHVTGPAGFTADLVSAFAGIDGLLLLVALGAVFVILIIVYRSPLLPLIVLGTAVFALSLAILVVWWLAKAGVVQINGQVQGILFILVIGAATDYALLYVARYREALRDHERRWDATWAALRGSFEPIAASAGTVIAGLLCLLLSDLNSNKSLGPVGAIGIACALLAALTLLPALTLVAGRVAFWPRKVAFGSEHPQVTGPDARGLWARVGRLISKHARPVWIVSDARAADRRGRAHPVPGGRRRDERARAHRESGARRPGGARRALPRRFGQPGLRRRRRGRTHRTRGCRGRPPRRRPSRRVLRQLADRLDARRARDAEPFPIPTTAPLEPTVVDGRVMLQVTLSDPADSSEAEATVRDLREAVVEVDAAAIVGGVTATAIDTDDTSIRDRTLIIPVVLVVILLILMLLLRSVLVPVLLILSVIVSFAATLGVAALVFDSVLGFPGADPSVPLYGFVFLVALGIDYNIFLMTRVREESLLHGTRTGVIRGLAITGGVITSAGVVLAATFAALGVIPVLFLAQIAFIVAFGVLLDTLLVRSLLVPALVHDLGRHTWWPSKLSRG